MLSHKYCECPNFKLDELEAKKGRSMLCHKICGKSVPIPILYNFTLQSKSTLKIGVILKMGGEHFEQHFLEIIGRILSGSAPPQMVVLAVFGNVRETIRTLVEERLTYLLKVQGSTLKTVWSDRNPLNVDSTCINEVVDKIVKWSAEMKNCETKSGDPVA